MSGRCAACNSILTNSEMSWDEETHEHNSICFICLDVIHKAEREDIFSMYIDDSVESLVNYSKPTTVGRADE